MRSVVERRKEGGFRAYIYPGSSETTRTRGQARDKSLREEAEDVAREGEHVISRFKTRLKM